MWMFPNFLTMLWAFLETLMDPPSPGNCTVTVRVFGGLFLNSPPASAARRRMSEKNDIRR
jgi:hypothetical protein